MDNFFNWKITLVDGKEYVVVSEDSDVQRFLEKVFKPNTVNAYRLRSGYNDNGMEINTIAIHRDQVTSVQYCCEY